MTDILIQDAMGLADIVCDDPERRDRLVKLMQAYLWIAYARGERDGMNRAGEYLTRDVLSSIGEVPHHVG